MTGLDFHGVAFVELAHSNFAKLAGERVVGSAWADLAGLQHLVVLNGAGFTFLWKRS
jgi:hypothetical protein